MREFVNHIHFVGIGGIGMSGIAEVLLNLGFTVSGSDLQNSAMTERLADAGAKIYIGHRAENIEGADAVVTSSAVLRENPEVCAAREAQVPLVRRAEMLGELMRFRKCIAIAGTHGKTTTTSLVAAVLSAAGMDPTFIVGGVVNSARTNARLGQGEYLVAEADESDASFLHLQPQMAVVTNIDADHMETYDGDFSRLVETYEAFLHNLPFYGLAILCIDDPVLKSLGEKLRKPVVTYGMHEEAEFRAINISHKNRDSYFEVIHSGNSLGEFSVSMPGKHNVKNALAAISIASKLGIEIDRVKSALSEFQGIGRRFEMLGEVESEKGKFQWVDDYAHHPTELEATLTAAEEVWPDKRRIIVFQPHRYSRTRDLFDDFAQLLSGIDNVLITDVYAAGEVPISGSDSKSLCRAIRRRGKDPIYAGSLDQLTEVLTNIIESGDVVLTLGAGDIGRYARSMAAKGRLQ